MPPAPRHLTAPLRRRPASSLRRRSSSASRAPAARASSSPRRSSPKSPARPGYEVVQTQSYGPEARGGASAAEVIVSREPIDFPEVERPDVTLCLSQEAFDKYAALTRAGGVVVYDDGLVEPAGLDGRARLVGLPFTATARELAGTPQAANMVALGALEGLLGLVGYPALVDSVHARLPRKLLEGNLKALNAGFEAARAAVTV